MRGNGITAALLNHITRTKNEIRESLDVIHTQGIQSGGDVNTDVQWCSGIQNWVVHILLLGERSVRGDVLVMC